MVALPGLVDGPSTADLPVLVAAGNSSGQAECGEASPLSAHESEAGKWGVRFTVSLPKMDLNPRNHSTQNYPRKSGGLSLGTGLIKPLDGLLNTIRHAGRAAKNGCALAWEEAQRTPHHLHDHDVALALLRDPDLAAAFLVETL